MKNISLFAKMIKTVSSLPWLKYAFEIEKRIPIEKINKNKTILEKTDHSDIKNPLADLTENEFEKLINKIFKQRGYTIIDGIAFNHDSVDLVLHQNHEATYVQYKSWKEKYIDENLIIEFYAAMETNQVKHGVVITSGVFTQEALEFSLGKAILLINGVDLSQMIEVFMQSGFTEEDFEEQKVSQPQKMPELEPLCPICSQKMIKRTARKGKNAGNIFWGCSQFPNCRGVVSS